MLVIQLEYVNIDYMCHLCGGFMPYLMRYFGFFLLFGTIVDRATALPHRVPRIKQVVYAFDFDGVILDFNVMYWLQLAREYKGYLPRLLCNRAFVRDVMAAWSARGLYDENNNKVVGSYQTVKYLVEKYMPWATELDLKRLNSVTTAVVPRDHMIDYALSLSVPYVVWTNNDKATYDIKVQTINALRAEKGNALFEPRSVHTVIPTGVTGATDKSNTKPHVEYYQRVYTETCTALGLQPGEVLIVFIDDKKENVIGAQEAAALYNLPIKAYYHWRLLGTSDRLKKLIASDTSWFATSLDVLKG